MNIAWVKEGSGGEINFAVDHVNLDHYDKDLIVRVILNKEPFNWLPRTATMIDVLVAAGVFSSKNDARRNWKGDIQIPEGMTDLNNIGKLKKRIFIHKVPDNYPETKLYNCEDDDVWFSGKPFHGCCICDRLDLKPKN